MDKVRQLERIIVALEKVTYKLDAIGFTQYSKVIDDLTYQLDQELFCAEQEMDNAVE